MFKVGSIGAGHMGTAILEAMPGADIIVYDKAGTKKGFTTAASEAEVYADCQILLLAVKPQDAEEVLTKLSEQPKSPATVPVIVSIMSGISSAFIRKFLGSDTPVITLMPTMGIKVNQSAAALAYTDNVPQDILTYIEGIFTSTGEAVVVDEPSLKEIVAVNGCMPGYVYYLIEAFARGAQGVDYDTAVRMVARGFIGAAMQVLEGGDAKALISEICTPGGLTARGVDYFNENRVDEILIDGMGESIKRGYELAK